MDDKECLRNRCILSKFYIKPQRQRLAKQIRRSCILSKFYIKPQLRHKSAVFPIVVSYRNSTSNHNRECGHPSELCVVSYRNSTSNHNVAVIFDNAVCVVSYRNSTSNHNVRACRVRRTDVVSYRNSTSNHNYPEAWTGELIVVSYRNSTSNHNVSLGCGVRFRVVSYRNSTSNHNTKQCRCYQAKLYLIEILHQTTTILTRSLSWNSCILSKFYIKPQRKMKMLCVTPVVSYRNSTSNHNIAEAGEYFRRLYLIEILHQTTTAMCEQYNSTMLYLIEILHQTTTDLSGYRRLLSCILSKFYIKPQHGSEQDNHSRGCILSKFYIKPQLRQRLSCSWARCILSKFYIKPQHHGLYRFAPQVVSYRNSTSNHNW